MTNEGKKMSKCANSSCDQPGKKKCSACSTVAYCGVSCQKAHWAEHKAVCKAARAKQAGASPPSSSSVMGGPHSVQAELGGPTISVDPNLARRISAAKSLTQAAYVNGDFEASIRHGMEALTVAKLLPEPAKSVETIQVELNLSSAYLQMGKFQEALNHGEICIEIAERAVVFRQQHPQSLDVLSVTLTNQSIIFLNVNRISEAEEMAMRSLSICETIFPTGDSRFYKTYRCLGLIRERQEREEEAEKYIRKAYVVAKSRSPCSPDAQTGIDDLLQLLMKKKDTAAAESLCKTHYEALLATPDAPETMLGEAAAKYGSILASLGKEAKAEPLMRSALKIREKIQGPNHMSVAITLMALSSIREAAQDFSETTEAMVERALGIFKKMEEVAVLHGQPAGPHVGNAVNSIRRIRIKRGSLVAAQQEKKAAEEDEDDDGIRVVSSSPSSLNRSSNGNGAFSSHSKSDSPPPLVGISSRSNESSHVTTMPTFEPGDGVGRMRVSAVLFEDGEFAKAEIILEEAYDIFLRAHGPDHPSTAAAKQNLEIVRINALNKLWHEVAKEETEKSTDGYQAGSGIDLLDPFASLSLDNGYQKKTSTSSCTVS